MSAKKLCVVIPTHKPQLTNDEKVSLKACCEKLSYYDCFLLYPRGMDVDEYINLYPDIILKPVNPAWLSSIEGYNRMKIDIEFYLSFSEYQYLLTYELDAYVFSSELDEIFLKFDYIGAPYFQGFLNALPDAPFIDGGNSGLSIRRIKSCINILNVLNNQYYKYWLLYKFVFSKSRVIRVAASRLTNRKFDTFIYGKLKFYYMNEHLNEDLIWSRIIPELFPKFKIADTSVALSFSFEVNPERLFEMNGKKLPFGCHAWPKFKSFWKNYIPVQPNLN